MSKRKAWNHDDRGKLLKCLFCGTEWGHRTKTRESYVCPSCEAGPLQVARLALLRNAKEN